MYDKDSANAKIIGLDCTQVSFNANVKCTSRTSVTI